MGSESTVYVKGGAALLFNLRFESRYRRVSMEVKRGSPLDYGTTHP